MRAVVQRVKSASVCVDNRVVGAINNGLLIYLGITTTDKEDDVCYIFDKSIGARIFCDKEGQMNIPFNKESDSVLVVSQFTLYGDLRKGRRPSFDEAAKSDDALMLYKQFIKKCCDNNIKTEQGVFGAHMEVESINDGPVTFLLDSKKIF